jgi:hypothetical protein
LDQQRLRILHRTIASIFGGAIAKSMLVSRWTGVAGVAAVGTITIAAGIDISYSPFPYADIAAGPYGISMMILLSGWEYWLGSCEEQRQRI